MRIESLDHLKELANSLDYLHFHILIAGGLAKSSKRIMYTKEIDEFSIIHEIDESYTDVYSSELTTKTNLMEAIDKGALFMDELQ